MDTGNDRGYENYGFKATGNWILDAAQVGYIIMVEDMWQDNEENKRKLLDMNNTNQNEFLKLFIPTYILYTYYHGDRINDFKGIGKGLDDYRRVLNYIVRHLDNQSLNDTENIICSTIKCTHRKRRRYFRFISNDKNKDKNKNKDKDKNIVYSGNIFQLFSNFKIFNNKAISNINSFKNNFKILINSGGNSGSSNENAWYHNSMVKWLASSTEEALRYYFVDESKRRGVWKIDVFKEIWGFRYPFLLFLCVPFAFRRYEDTDRYVFFHAPNVGLMVEALRVVEKFESLLPSKLRDILYSYYAKYSLSDFYLVSIKPDRESIKLDTRYHVVDKIRAYMILESDIHKKFMKASRPGIMKRLLTEIEKKKGKEKKEEKERKERYVGLLRFIDNFLEGRYILNNLLLFGKLVLRVVDGSSIQDRNNFEKLSDVLEASSYVSVADGVLYEVIELGTKGESADFTSPYVIPALNIVSGASVELIPTPVVNVFEEPLKRYYEVVGRGGVRLLNLHNFFRDIGKNGKDYVNRGDVSSLLSSVISGDKRVFIDKLSKILLKVKKGGDWERLTSLYVKPSDLSNYMFKYIINRDVTWRNYALPIIFALIRGLIERSKTDKENIENR